MSDRRAPVKITLLITPLFVTILALHAWGEALAGGLGRAVGSWQYPESAHSNFLIRAPRRSNADVFAARGLEEFVAQAVRVHGAVLGIQAPGRPVKVVLLDADGERRFGGPAAEFLKENEGLFDPASRTILVRMERRINPELVLAALREATARLLLHDAGSARWSPWLTEGLVGRLLEGSKGSAPRGWTGEVSLNELLSSREADFHGGISGPGYARAARMLVAWMAESIPDGFEVYYNAERKGRPDLSSIFDERFGHPRNVESALKDWPRAPK
jgi:hypothetical protein